MNKIFQSFVFISTIAIFILVSTETFSLATTTGDSTAGNVVETQVNTNIINCDCTPTPTTSITPTVTLTPTPTTSITPTVTLTPTPTTEITPTPTDTPHDNGEKPGDGLSDGRSDGKSSSPIQAVLGLSSTSSDNNLLIQFFQLIAALSLSVLAFKLFRKNA